MPAISTTNAARRGGHAIRSANGLYGVLAHCFRLVHVYALRVSQHRGHLLYVRDDCDYDRDTTPFVKTGEVGDLVGAPVGKVHLPRCTLRKSLVAVFIEAAAVLVSTSISVSTSATTTTVAPSASTISTTTALRCFPDDFDVVASGLPLPMRSSFSLKVTLSPSSSIPASRECTKMSGPPSSGDMKPKPLLVTHLTTLPSCRHLEVARKAITWLAALKGGGATEPPSD
eukprot:CAMPEP_0169300306 /NCGR_PEP_ID=MMETSP1016-20121227/67560_1 /TAXON_ID=342587 /ORGANISM="Karlodinium micrum, Strain CCMP2283" /LENGTH=227 /DNA_ID=CAMNT_0009392669 /DNA_START=22 /DNA_END=704 /DNA_ORIENTATION=-